MLLMMLAVNILFNFTYEHDTIINKILYYIINKIIQ